MVNRLGNSTYWYKTIFFIYTLDLQIFLLIPFLKINSGILTSCKSASSISHISESSSTFVADNKLNNIQPQNFETRLQNKTINIFNSQYSENGNSPYKSDITFEKDFKHFWSNELLTYQVGLRSPPNNLEQEQFS
jgi:hypothetical protein